MNAVSRTRLVLGIGTVIATSGTIGSLFLGGAGFAPCELCWYQRILLYPLVVILAVGTIENRQTVYRSALPFTLVGIGIAGYHSWLQFSVPESSCTIGAVSCSTVQVQIVGLSIPNLSLVTFSLLTGLLAYLAFDHHGGYRHAGDQWNRS